MPCLPFLPVVTFFVAISTIPAVYFLFDEMSFFNEGVSKIVESESKVLSDSNVTYQRVNEDPDILVTVGVGADEDPDILVTVIDAFCQVCYSGEFQFSTFFGVVF